mmetsp:Transcript_7954/g.12770  ORF Transcript_7954/g.12770 Transcript_7954/m.12770 type:complete len:112 (-) Transcript_7954:853-1188(-)
MGVLSSKSTFPPPPPPPSNNIQQHKPKPCTALTAYVCPLTLPLPTNNQDQVSTPSSTLLLLPYPSSSSPSHVGPHTDIHLQPHPSDNTSPSLPPPLHPSIVTPPRCLTLLS